MNTKKHTHTHTCTLCAIPNSSHPLSFEVHMTLSIHFKLAQKIKKNKAKCVACRYNDTFKCRLQWGKQKQTNILIHSTCTAHSAYPRGIVNIYANNNTICRRSTWGSWQSCQYLCVNIAGAHTVGNNLSPHTLSDFRIVSLLIFRWNDYVREM